MKNKTIYYLVLGIFFFSGTIFFYSCQQEKEQSFVLFSPDGNVKIELTDSVLPGWFDTETQLAYSVFMKEDGEWKSAVKHSPLGITREDEDFSSEITFSGVSDVVKIDDSYTMIAGKQTTVQTTYNEKVVSYKNIRNKTVEIILRAFNDGVAFAYRFPEESDKQYKVLEELTGFHIPSPGKAWIQPYDTLNVWSPAHEYGYEPVIEIGEAPPMTTGWGFPALFHNEQDLWVYVSETGVYDSYCGSHLKADAEDGKYKLAFPHAWENYGLGNRHPVSNLPWQTPWRVIIVGNDLSTIVESTIVQDLALPVQLEDVSWIEPGVSSWSWWGDHSSGRNFEKLKDYVDLAAEMGWTYSLVDADWHIMEGGTLEELAAYAKTKDVGLFIWYNSGGPHTQVMNAGPRDMIHERQTRRKEFQRIAELGIKGIKVDFFQSEKQSMIQLYLDILRDAADFELLVNYHGCTFPRGWQRPYPNLLTMEAVRGAELYSYFAFPPTAPYLNNIYPYTRNIMGSMDYTPVTFTDYSAESVRVTTWAHELALSVIFESALQHFADRIEGFNKQPQQVIDFLKNVPTTWDETRLIDGYPGKHTAIARKKDNIWYVAAINGESDTKLLSMVPFFLPDGKFTMQLIKDGDSKEEYRFEEFQVDNNQVMNVEMLPAGGFAGIIVLE